MIASEVDEHDAMARWEAILKQVENGHEFIITRHGKEVARLVPSRAGFNRDAARAAAQSIRAMRQGVALGKLKIKDLINAGRR
jgi:prevent-host-death family protein